MPLYVNCLPGLSRNHVRVIHTLNRFPHTPVFIPCACNILLYGPSVCKDPDMGNSTTKENEDKTVFDEGLGEDVEDEAEVAKMSLI